MGTAAHPGHRAWRSRRCLAVIAGLAVLSVTSALATGMPSGVAHAIVLVGTPERVLVTSTGDHSELREAIPIARRPGRKPRVVMSLSPAELPGFGPGDSLEATSELEVTTDCLRRDRRCVGRPYRYSPAVTAQLVLADAQRSATGPGALPISKQREIRCSQRAPNRQHHCVIVFSAADYELGDIASWPCAPGSCSVNLVVSAHHRRAHRRHRLIIGADEPDGSVHQDKGRINAVRFRDPVPGLLPPPVQPRRTSARTTKRVNRLLRIRRRVVVYSQRLDGVRAGEQLAAWAKMRTAVPRRRHIARVTTKMILGRTPHSAAAGHAIRRIAPWRAEVAEDNGFNCTRLTTPCTTTKVGVTTIEKEPLDRHGKPFPLYVNLVVTSGEPSWRSRHGRVPRVRPEGGLQVVRFPAELQG